MSTGRTWIISHPLFYLSLCICRNRVQYCSICAKGMVDFYWQNLDYKPPLIYLSVYAETESYIVLLMPRKSAFLAD